MTHHGGRWGVASHLAASALLLLLGARAFAQAPPKPEPEKAKEPSEEGIPVTDPLVISKCSSCHKQDAKGNLTRISWERTTPEAWQGVIKRMVRLNGLTITPEEARQVVRYLSRNHGLAPEEAKPGMYLVEHRAIDETVPDTVRDACTSCHAWGVPMNWRRSKEEWELLVAMHVGYFPVAEFTAFRTPPPRANAPPPAPGADTRQPVDKAIELLAKSFPLHTPEWAEWRASMRSPKLAGRWLLTGSQAGRGRIFGEVVIEPGSAEDEFTTSTRLAFVKDGAVRTSTGKALIYGGYAWRGRSQRKDAAAGGLLDPQEAREVMLVARDQSQIEGRWFWGGYEEFGIDVKLRRAGSEAVVLGLDRSALRAGTAGNSVRIFGDNLSTDIAASDIDFGSGVTVKQVVEKSAGRITVEVDVAEKAISGKRDVVVRRAVAIGAYAVYDRIDYIKVSPEHALTRLGGTTHPKGHFQFDAIGYNRGIDGKPNTPDDVNLGTVDVEWSVEEFLAVYGDDDRDFVGTLSPTGLFTPSLEGPNPKRKFGRNNYGDVWVVATYRGKDVEPAKDGKPLSARSYLVVTIPLYMRWDQPEVAQ